MRLLLNQFKDRRLAVTAYNAGPEAVDLVAIGSPHASFGEIKQFADLMGGRPRNSNTDVIVTIGRTILNQARDAGLVQRLEMSGVKFIKDLCWCSITEPAFPPKPYRPRILEEYQVVVIGSGIGGLMAAVALSGFATP